MNDPVHSEAPNIRGVLLMTMGGPARPDQVEGFIASLLADPNTLPFPLGPFRNTLARWIARRRTPMVQKRYGEIGGGSPLPSATHALGHYLSDTLHCPVEVGFRYSSPRTSDGLALLRHRGVHSVTALPLYPHYCRATSGSSIDELYKIAPPDMNIRVVSDHARHPGVLSAWQELLAQTISTSTPHADDGVLFVAHAIPLRLVRRGDSYVTEMKATVRHLSKGLPDTCFTMLAFQSRLGPMAWQGPDLETALMAGIQQGVRRLIVFPLSFVSENLETCFDLDIHFRKKCMAHGVSMLRVPTLDHSSTYRDALRSLLKEALGRGPCGCYTVTSVPMAPLN